MLRAKVGLYVVFPGCRANAYVCTRRTNREFEKDTSGLTFSEGEAVIIINTLQKLLIITAAN